jgi:hypothetical protein
MGGRGKMLGATLAVILLIAMAPTSAASAAGSCNQYGWLDFPVLHGPEDPEGYCWELDLGEEEELAQVDDRHVVVRWSDGTIALHIEATAAHDVEGSAVPTTIAVTGPHLITLTVHHRAGNPAAGGAPFFYPIVPGVGWEGGFRTTQVLLSEPQAAGVPAYASEAQVPSARCEVPRLRGRSLKSARRALLRAHCKLGPVRGQHRRGDKVVKQYRPAGEALPAGTEVGVKLA